MMITQDANEAVARIAFLTNEGIVIYPITPASPMGEWADSWSSQKRKNLWGTVPTVVEMQAEGGAAGALHGALQAGCLATTFTASQGLLLMIPNMYKIAGELTPGVVHVAARSLAAQALSIFCDHSDVMAARGTGFALFCSNSVQEAADFALISQATTLKSRIPFLHFFDGFRTSHEVAKFKEIPMEIIGKMIDDQWVADHRKRALSPDHPFIRGTAQNPDVFFQARESVNSYYDKCVDITQEMMDQFGELTGRHYQLYQYEGHPEAERVMVLMGSACETTGETVAYLQQQGEKVGLLKVRLYRPFAIQKFCEALPSTIKSLAILDRTKEPGSGGEPLYLDCLQALWEGKEKGWFKADSLPKVIGGRFGLSSKEFTPGMVKGILDHLKREELKNHFTIGIEDDLTHTNLTYDPDFSSESEKTFRGLFYGLGSDGTVGSNKSAIKIIGENTDNHALGYFVYDSKKSGAITVSHLRFGPEPIRSEYLITRANFIACHQTVFLERYDMLQYLEEGGTFLLNTNASPEKAWDSLPKKLQEEIQKKKINFYVINGYEIAKGVGLGNRLGTIMMTCFFKLSSILDDQIATKAIDDFIVKEYSKKGDKVVQMNRNAVQQAGTSIHKVEIPSEITSSFELPPAVSPEAPEFIRNVLGEIIAKRGDALPVSAFPVDGTYPSGSTRWEKRNLALEIPHWEPHICIQCNKCAMVCPHGVIRIKVYDRSHLRNSPSTFQSCVATHFQDLLFSGDLSGQEDLQESRIPQSLRGEFEKNGQALSGSATLSEHKKNREWLIQDGLKDFIVKADKREEELKIYQANQYTIQVAPEDCTGCEICVEVCPAKDKKEAKKKALNMVPQPPLRIAERENWDFFLELPEMDRSKINIWEINQQQVQEPLFEFSGACAGCGETPYLKLITQLFGDRAVVANATGCSSIFGANLPTTPWSKNKDGRGPSWSNSLFEDNAEFGLGMRIALDKNWEMSRDLVRKVSGQIGETLAKALLDSPQKTEVEICAQRERVVELRKKLAEVDSPSVRRLLSLADYLVKKSMWIVGGDGWAYDIGYGGLDHVLASGYNVNVVVLDTEVYSNTGGQQSKATPKAAVAKFAAGGKRRRKKDLGLMAMTYGDVYVASVAMGGNDKQTLHAFIEAESYEGCSLIICYSHCIAHGLNMSQGMENQKLATQSGQWMMYRFDPRKLALETPENPLTVDSPRLRPEKLQDYFDRENRFKMLRTIDPKVAKELFEESKEDVKLRRQLYDYLAGR